MKSKFSKNKIFLISSIIVISLFLIFLYTGNSFPISSCTGLLTEDNGGGLCELPPDSQVSAYACPGIPIVEYADTQPPEPPGSNSNSVPPSSGSSSGSGSKVMNSPEFNSSKNESKLNLSPIINESEKNNSVNSSFSDKLIQEYLIKNKIELSCVICNKQIKSDTYLVTIKGNRIMNFLLIKIKVPTEVKLLISKDKIDLECIKSPWWAYFLR